MNRLFAFSFASPARLVLAPPSLSIQIYRFLMKEFSSALTFFSIRLPPFDVFEESYHRFRLLIIPRSIKDRKPGTPNTRSKCEGAQCGKFLRLFRALFGWKFLSPRPELSKHRPVNRLHNLLANICMQKGRTRVDRLIYSLSIMNRDDYWTISCAGDAFALHSSDVLI